MTSNRTNPAEWLNLYGDALYGFAMARLHDKPLAEDLVQETLLAGLKGRDRFAGKASEKTWLTGILKHKIVDHFRKSSREIVQDVDDTMISQAMESSFDQRGHWLINADHQSWPDKSLEREQLSTVLADCVERLPSRLNQLLVLRYLDDVTNDEICEILNISTTNNLWVMLSRMRLQLRNCMDTHWFSKHGS